MTKARASDLPPPGDISRSPKVLVGELRDHVGEGPAVAVCVALLSGADPQQFATEIPYLAAQAAPNLLLGIWQPYWARVWGARGLLYVWRPTAAPAVVNGLHDEAWRVAEMCLKVSALRELAEAGDLAVPLTSYELPRVRANALRALGLVGDTEHVEVVEAGLDDPEASVRRAAQLALGRLTDRLDLVRPGGTA